MTPATAQASAMLRLLQHEMPSSISASWGAAFRRSPINWANSSGSMEPAASHTVTVLAPARVTASMTFAR